VCVVGDRDVGATQRLGAGADQWIELGAGNSWKDGEQQQGAAQLMAGHAGHRFTTATDLTSVSPSALMVTR
jgi:hypothetical protein